MFDNGSVVGRLTIVSDAPDIAQGHRTKAVVCSCGRRFLIRVAHLKQGVTACRSCSSSTHGQDGSPTHRCWSAMHQRCRSHLRYIRKGIVVCDRWSSFEAFLADMGERPTIAHTLDRIDNARGYEPSNCRWATYAQQARNRDCSVLTEDKARRIVDLWALRTMTAAEIAREVGVSKGVASGVIRGLHASDVTGIVPSYKRMRRPQSEGGTEWAKRVEARLADLDKDRVWLCEKTGASPGMISSLLSSRLLHSRYVPAISTLLGIDVGDGLRSVPVSTIADRRAKLTDLGRAVLDAAKARKLRLLDVAAHIGVSQSGLSLAMRGVNVACRGLGLDEMESRLRAFVEGQ